MQRFHETVRSHKHVVLLACLVLMAAGQPFAHGVVGGLVIYDILLTTVLVATFVIAFKAGRQRAIALALALPAIASRWVEYVLAGDERHLAVVTHHGFMLVFFAFAVVIILQGAFEEKMIRLDQIVATVCGYLLAGGAFGNCYVLFDLLVPNSFQVQPVTALDFANEHVRSFAFNFFSLCTLCGLKYDDVQPALPGPLTLTWIEATFGQFYIAVVVGQFVGLKLAQSVDRQRSSS